MEWVGGGGGGDLRHTFSPFLNVPYRVGYPHTWPGSWQAKEKEKILNVAWYDLGYTMDVQHGLNAFLWSFHRHLNMGISFRWCCRLYNHVLSLTKEWFPLPRFIWHRPFQDMSLHEQYSRWGAAKLKTRELSSYKFDNYYICKLLRMYMTSTNGEIYMSRTIPTPSFLGILWGKSRKLDYKSQSIYQNFSSLL